MDYLRPVTKKKTKTIDKSSLVEKIWPVLSGFCACLYAFVIGMFLYHSKETWENVSYLEHSDTLIGLAIAFGVGTIAFSLIWLGTLEGFAYEERTEEKIRDIFTSLVFAGILITATVTYIRCSNMIYDIEANAYRSRNIECVYTDNGKAQNAVVQYHVDDGTKNGRSCEFPAYYLGYADVELDESIPKPKEKLKPEGVTLLVPESYLRNSHIRAVKP